MSSAPQPPAGTAAGPLPRPDSRAPLGIRLAAWYLALLVPTLLFKLAYAWTLTGGDLANLSSGAAGAPASIWWLAAGRLFPADAFEVAWLVAALAIVGRGILRIPLARLATVSTGLALIAGAAHALALRELGTLLSLDTLAAAVNWTAGSQSSAAAFVTPRRLMFAAAGCLWIGAPAALTWLLHRCTRDRPVLRHVLAGLLVAGLGFSLTRAPQAVWWPGATSSALTRGFWRSAALSLADGDPAPAPDIAGAPESRALLDAYARLAFPRSPAAAPSWLLDVPSERRVPRHVVLISLETAPAAFYDLDRADLPAFRAMREHAVVGEQHQTTAPMSSMAVYSMLSGTYPRAGASIVRYGDFQADSLPALLRPRGYESTYIDSYDLQWNGPDEIETVRALGFEMIRDALSDRLPPQPDAYTRRVARERHSLDLARTRILDAASRGRHAFVTVVTHLGHFEWPAPAGMDDRPAREKLAGAVRVLDTLLGEFLGALHAAELQDDLILVITGDHGLRFRAEFESLGEPVHYGDVTFHVPLLIYAPGLLPAGIRVPYVTSHVDIAPTLLDLTGTPRDEALHHGGNVLDRRLADRITFLSSGAFPGLRPEDGFHWQGDFYAWHEVVDRVTVRRAGEAAARELAPDAAGEMLTPEDVRTIVRSGRQVFNETAAVFLKRR